MKHKKSLYYIIYNFICHIKIYLFYIIFIYESIREVLDPERQYCNFFKQKRYKTSSKAIFEFKLFRYIMVRKVLLVLASSLVKFKQGLIDERGISYHIHVRRSDSNTPL